ncbi:hypothetical protein [Porphyromonas sp.]|nr:hypothetical protein [Porphyromonas sp.]MDO4770837.1 hypothetical protein [Porphyromonas sp.]
MMKDSPPLFRNFILSKIFENIKNMNYILEIKQDKSIISLAVSKVYID